MPIGLERSWRNCLAEDVPGRDAGIERTGRTFAILSETVPSGPPPQGADFKSSRHSTTETLPSALPRRSRIKLGLDVKPRIRLVPNA